MFSKLVKHYKKRLSAVILSRGDLTNILIVVPIILQCFAERKRKKDQFGVLFLQFISSTICRFLLPTTSELPLDDSVEMAEVDEHHPDTISASLAATTSRLEGAKICTK